MTAISRDFSIHPGVDQEEAADDRQLLRLSIQQALQPQFVFDRTRGDNNNKGQKKAENERQG